MSSRDPRPAPGGQARAPRADARRNRDRLLRAARTAFAAAEGPVSLEGVAREAGVGIGTLYRHFPTREALVEAVYAAELDDVVDSASALLRECPPDAAFRAWTRRYAAFVATKRGMADTLRASLAAGRITGSATRERVTAAVGMLLSRGAEAGTLRADVRPEDVTVMLLGVFLAADTADQTTRLIDLLVDALRPPPP